MNPPVASPRKLGLLQWEVANLQRWLDGFEAPVNGKRRLAQAHRSGEYISVLNHPLPDRYRPDFADILVLTDGFPGLPPIGLYLLNQHNAGLIRQLQGRFNAFRDGAFHDAPAIPGYTWICYHYEGNSWRYRADAPAFGDNIGKFLAGFFAESAK